MASRRRGGGSRRGGRSRRHQSLCDMLSALLCAGLGHRAGAWFMNERAKPAKRDARGDAGRRKNERGNQWKNRLHKTQPKFPF
jgi:hypothetical protein